MEEFLTRTELLIGKENVKKLSHSRVAVFGIGGVGGFVVEGLVRSGIGEIDLIDKDVVSESNINRQIIATKKTIGRYKTEVMKERISDINPDCKVNVFNMFFLPETSEEISFKNYDYVVDAIDTISGKIAIIEKCKRENVPIISCMGAGNKLDPTKFEVADIYSTKICPLSKVMRRELKKRGIDSLKVVYSTEEAKQPQMEVNTQDTLKEKEETEKNIATTEKPKRSKIPVGSISFVPSVAGLVIASEVIKDLIADCK